MRRHLLFLVLPVLLVAWQPVSAHVRITTFTGSMPRWIETVIPYSISEDGASQIPNGSEFVAVQAAFETWEAVESAAVDFQYQGTTPQSGVGLDGLNLVTFDDDSGLLGSTTLAATFSFFRRSGGELPFDESDIAFNPAHALTTSGESGRFDIQNIVTHEVGHLLGLDHSGLISSVMAPFAVINQVDQRTLSYDDIAGISGIYPNSSGNSAAGAIQGSIRSSDIEIFGAHVVAIDADGTNFVSTMSRRDGTYDQGFLPPGEYRVYAEPLDGPVSREHISGFFGSLNTDFGTTYFGDVRALTEASTVVVASGSTTTAVDIAALPAGTSGFDLTRPVFGIRVPRGDSDTVRVGGENVVDGVSFSMSTPQVRFDSVTFAGRLATTARTSATLETRVDLDTPLGPKTIIGIFRDELSLISGGIVVTNPPPIEIEASPSSVPFEGGSVINISGQNFRSGIQVFFAGLPAADVQFLNPGMLQATVPENAPGPANIQLINPDGTAGLLEGGFNYTAPPPVISQVRPENGPPATLVVIDGSSFDTRPQNIEVRFNGVRARIVTSTRTRIETVVPFGAATGPLTVSVFGVEVAAGTFTVTDPEPSTNVALGLVEFIDASTSGGGTNLSFPNEDDAVFFTDLPFTFSLFRDTFIAGARISIATNGWISLDAASLPEFQNAALPARNVARPSGSEGVIPAAMIAPFFDDLILSGSAARVSTRLTGAVGSRLFVVQWSGVSILDSVGNDLDADLTFELILL